MVKGDVRVALERATAPALLLMVGAGLLAWPPAQLYLALHPGLRTGSEEWALVLCSPLAALFVVWLRARLTLPRPLGYPVLLGQAGLLLATCTGSGLVVATGFVDQASTVSAEVAADAAYGSGLIGSTLVLAAVLLRPLTMWARILLDRPEAPPGPAPSRPAPGQLRGPEPAAGHVWIAWMPFDDDTGGKMRPCLVVRTFAHHAQVLKITSQDKSARPEYVRMPVSTWDPRAHHDSWMELYPLRDLPYTAFGKPAGVCPLDVWCVVARQYDVV